ncbi:MAG TPA: amidohydrolase [Nocardiopsis listeri]|uniref:amidohydrolase n=1 Tax=Nocardiopsis listeri TaxID=53440 RepID=UPI001E016657|nr:amidohydrolase [Nocardiopsis listeri]HJE59377.1 amidohydrolase [Nocardiopsis listeri]
MVAFRADTDALPIRAESGLDHASTAVGTLDDGTEAPVMHGCGHDTHITSALTAARALALGLDAWSGTLVLVFQPGEETAVGARVMVDDGLWDRAPRPDIVLGRHVMPLPVGTVTVGHGTAMSMADSLKVTLYGRQAHGSQPQASVDPIVLGAHVVTRLQTIVSRELDPRSPAVITCGTFHAGIKENIIPAQAEFTLNIRTFEPEVRDQVLAAVRRVITGEAAVSNAPEPLIEELYRFPRCHNDPDEAVRIETALRAEPGEDNVSEGAPNMGSEDFGHLADAIGVPSVYWMFGGFDPADGEPPSNHSPYFAPVMEPTLTTGARAAITGILTYLGSGADRSGD